MLHFDREGFLRSLPPDDEAQTLIQGEIRNKHYFSGHDVVRVLRPHLQSPNGGERLGAGTFRDITWESEELNGVDSIVLYYSPDGGQSWQPQGSVPGGTHFTWRVPANATTQGLLKVEAYALDTFIGYDVTDAAFSVTNETTGIDPTAELRTMLLPNSPNPFRGSTRIGYTLAARAQVSLDIFNVSGRKVRTLVHDALDAGAQQATWDGRDDTGRHVTPGFYVVRLRTADAVASRRLLLMP
jgi:flagellar hook capping protein FlgD